MEKLAVFDYMTSTLHIYEKEKNLIIDDEYVSNLGFKLTQCDWMSGDMNFEVHKEILK